MQSVSVIIRCPFNRYIYYSPPLVLIKNPCTLRIVNVMSTVIRTFNTFPLKNMNVVSTVIHIFNTFPLKNMNVMSIVETSDVISILKSTAVISSTNAMSAERFMVLLVHSGRLCMHVPRPRTVIASTVTGALVYFIPYICGGPTVLKSPSPTHLNSNFIVNFLLDSIDLGQKLK